MMSASEPAVPSAVVIQFPVQPGAANQRLSRALAALSVALDDQRNALAAWRSALVELRTAVGALGSSLQTYSSRLGDLKQDVAGLHHQAVVLERGVGDTPRLG